VPAGPLGDLGALRVKHGTSHAKNAKGAKDGIEENGGPQILFLRVLLAILARFA
jgi:hypothetical protein